jgi:hypothetical protein
MRIIVASVCGVVVCLAASVLGAVDLRQGASVVFAGVVLAMSLTSAGTTR